MKFIIATPSYNNLSDLRRCIGSVKAQALPELLVASCGLRVAGSEQLSVHHIVQDGGSENFSEFAAAVKNQKSKIKNQQFRYLLQMHSEADNGMYDAINKAWGRGEGDVYSWLNCDEQYLPGTLAKVADYFERNPEVDAVFGWYVIVDGEGTALAARRDIPLRRVYVANDFLYAASCTTFYRKRVRDRGILELDASYRYSSDVELVLRLMAEGVRFGQIQDYLSLFGLGEGNLSFSAEMEKESREIKDRYGRWRWPWARQVLKVARYLERWRAGCYRREDVAFDFAINEVPDYEWREAKGLGTRFEYNWYRKKPRMDTNEH